MLQKLNRKYGQNRKMKLNWVILFTDDEKRELGDLTHRAKTRIDELIKELPSDESFGQSLLN